MKVWVALLTVPYHGNAFLGVALTRDAAKAICQAQRDRPMVWDDDPYGTGTNTLSIEDWETFRVVENEVVA